MSGDLDVKHIYNDVTSLINNYWLRKSFVSTRVANVYIYNMESNLVFLCPGKSHGVSEETEPPD